MEMTLAPELQDVPQDLQDFIARLDEFIEREIKPRIGDEMLFGALENGGKAIVDLADGKLDFSFVGTNTTAPRPDGASTADTSVN